jgi:hypothetical protein
VASEKSSGCLKWVFVSVAAVGLALLFSPKRQDQRQEPAPPAAPVANLPSYRMLFANDKAGGGRFGDALVPTLSRATPEAERERIARGIAQKEGLTNLAIYSTEDAYKANVSASFGAQHPDAMRGGFLGSLDGGSFRPGEEN